MNDGVTSIGFCLYLVPAALSSPSLRPSWPALSRATGPVRLWAVCCCASACHYPLCVLRCCVSQCCLAGCLPWARARMRGRPSIVEQSIEAMRLAAAQRLWEYVVVRSKLLAHLQVAALTHPASARPTPHICPSFPPFPPSPPLPLSPRDFLTLCQPRK